MWILKNVTSGTLSGVFSNYGSNGQSIGDYDGKSWEIWYGADFTGNSLNGGNDVALFAVDVPEPSIYALLLCDIAAKWTISRKRRLDGSRTNATKMKLPPTNDQTGLILIVG